MITYTDAIDHLTDYLGGNADDKVQREIRKAIQAGLRELANTRQWRYLHRVANINVNAAYTTGTLSYDHCVTPEHEALTRDGWKRHTELSVGDEILSYDHERGVTLWLPIQNLHVFEGYSGKVLEVTRKGRTVLRCTPNHRLPVLKRTGRSRTMERDWVLAKDVTEEHCVPLSAPLDDGDGDSCLSGREAALLSWAVTDGCGLDGRSTVFVCQSETANPHKCQEIEALVGRKAWRKVGGNVFVDNPDYVSLKFGLLPKDARTIRGQCPQKDSIVQCFAGLGRLEAASAVRAMLLADGSSYKKQRVFSQWGENRLVAEAFQIACILAGGSANLASNEFYSDYHGRKIARHACCVRTSDHIKPAKGSRWVDYSGVVWCPQVATGAWVMRCNGAVMMTGNSGGTYERQLTLATGTWPSWAANGVVRVTHNSTTCDYPVDRRISASVVTLVSDPTPGADFTASSYTLYQDAYTLPVDFLAAGQVYHGQSSAFIWSHQDQHTARRLGGASGIANSYTIRQDRKNPGRSAIYLDGWPTAAGSLEFVIRAQPRPLIYTGYANRDRVGKVSISGQTVTGDGTAFESGMEGAVFRASTNGVSYPTADYGGNPYVSQSVIQSVESATSLTLRDSVTTATSVKYTISDPVGIADYMVSLFYRCCEKQAEISRQRDSSSLSNTLALYNDELFRIMALDSKLSFEPKPLGGYIVSRNEMERNQPCGSDVLFP